MKRLVSLCMVLIFMTVGVGCGFIEAIQDGNDPLLKNWRMIEKSAKGGQVTMVMDQNDEKIANWLKNDFKNYLSQNYDVELVVIEQPLSKTIEQLDQERKTEKLLGEVDLVYLSGSGFKTGFDKKLWYGPFTHELPNVRDFIDPFDTVLLFRDGIESQGHLLPFGQEQLTMLYNRDVFFDAPSDINAFVEAVMDYKGTFIYPDPRVTREGEAFVIGMMLANQDVRELLKTAPDKEKMRSLVGPGLETLKKINPFLYGEGKSFPTSMAEIDRRFLEEELLFSLSMNYNQATEKLQAYEYPEGAHSFVFDQGTLSYAEAMTIAHNAPNKSGAMVVLNALLNPAVQAEKYDTRKWGQLPIYTIGFAPEEAYTEIKAIRVRPASIKQDTLLSRRIPDLPESMRKTLIQLWTETLFESESE